MYTYVAPWQITWGSAFHAFAQPFAVPRILQYSLWEWLVISLMGASAYSRHVGDGRLAELAGWEGYLF